MSDIAKLHLPDKTVDLPVVVGTEQEHAVDIRKLRSETGYITLDDGYGNTGSCESAITFIDGEKGILRYRGIPIEQLAEKSTFLETALLLIYGELPTQERLDRFKELVTREAYLHEGLIRTFDGFPPDGHPMAILSAMINAMSCYHPALLQMEDEDTFELAAARLLSKVLTIAAFSYRIGRGMPHMYPREDLGYCANFLHMMFSMPSKNYEIDPIIETALNLIFILHADHEQNCSTSTVRMVGSSGANLFASCSAGVCALWGPLHGGANVAVVDMLEKIHASGETLSKYIERVKKKEVKLMGFGHRVYKNYDPRARIVAAQADKVLSKLNIKHDPLLDMAREMEQVALSDDYFKERNLYPNVDFYSGIIMRAMGIPLNAFTVMFAIGRMPGWIANWKEVHDDTNSRINRPRQVYTGHGKRDYVAIDKR